MFDGDATAPLGGQSTIGFGFAMADHLQLLDLLASHGFVFDSSSGPSGGFSDVSSVNNLERYPSFVALLSETNAQQRKTSRFIDRRIGIVGDTFQPHLSGSTTWKPKQM